MLWLLGFVSVSVGTILSWEGEEDENISSTLQRLLCVTQTTILHPSNMRQCGATLPLRCGRIVCAACGTVWSRLGGECVAGGFVLGVCRCVGVFVSVSVCVCGTVWSRLGG